MALDILKLAGSVSIDIGKAEANLKQVDATAKKTAQSLNNLSGASGKSLKFGVDLSGFRAGIDGLKTRIAGLGEAGSAGLEKLRASLTLTGNSLKVVRETVESVSSEIIESFGVDGDVANLLANNLNKVKLSSIAAGGAIAGLVIGVGVLTTAMASVGAEIQKTSQLTGLTTTQVQKYQSAADIAGVKTSVFTDAIRSLSTRAKEALQGNFELAANFKTLGVDAASAARNAGPAFEAFLNILEQVPDAQTRVTIAQRILGDATDETLTGIIRLTDANGQLRKELEKLGVALDEKAVEELARVNRELDTFGAKLNIFVKKTGLAIIEELEFIGLALGGETEELKKLGGASDKASSAVKGLTDLQKAAAFAFANTTGKIGDQAKAIKELSAVALSSRIDTMQKGVADEITRVAFNSKNAKEAVANFKKEMASNQALGGNVALTKQLKDNQEAIDRYLNPPKKSAGPKVLSEFQQLQKQVAEANKDLEGFKKFGSEEFKLRIKLQDSRRLKSDLDEILSLRRSLGEVVAAPFPTTPQGAQSEIGRLQAFKTARELVSKQDIAGPLRDSAAASAKALGDTFTELDRLIKDALPQSIELTTEQALVQNELYQALLKTNPILAEQYRIDAQGADAKIRSLRATEAFKGLQDRLNDQLQSFRNLTVEQSTALELQTDRYKDLTAAQQEQLLTQARQIDAQGAFREQMEQSRQALEQFADTTKGLFETLFNEGPKAFFDNLLSTLKRTLSKMAAEIATSALFKALGFQGAASAVGTGGGQSAGGIGGLLGQLFGGGTAPGRGGGFLTGGFAGGNPAGAILGGGTGGQGGILGGLLGKIPGLGGIFGGGRGIKTIGGLPVATGRFPVGITGLPGAAGTASPGLLGSLGGLGVLGGGGLLGGLLGGSSPIGGLLGNVGGSLLAGFAGASGLFGGGIASALPAFFSNPITAIIGGGILGGLALSKLFGGGAFKKFRDAVEGEYQVRVKGDQGGKALFQQIEALGKSAFGSFDMNVRRTIQLDEARNLIGQYAESTNQEGSALAKRLRQIREIGDIGNPANQFVRRQFGGPLLPGQLGLVGEAGPELVRFGMGAQVFPATKPRQTSQQMAAILGALVEQLERIGAVPPGQVFMQGAEQSRAQVGRIVREGFAASPGEQREFSQQLGL